MTIFYNLLSKNNSAACKSCTRRNLSSCILGSEDYSSSQEPIIFSAEEPSVEPALKFSLLPYMNL